MLRWATAGVYLVGMLCWWWPSYRAWGAMTVALLGLGALWVLWRIHTGDRTAPGHPAQLVLAGPMAVLGWHLARTGLGASGDEPLAAAAVNVSAMWQLALVALGLVVTQSLMPRAARAAALSVCAAAMTAGAVAAGAWGQVAPVRSAVALVGFAGVAVWLAALCDRPSAASSGRAFDHAGGRPAG
ncbi:MAG: hypothetical protein ACOC8F_04970, partial [Planctomycetota bacterium]